MILDARVDRVGLERELIHRGGLAEYTRMAWRQVEPRPLVWNWHLDAICEHLEAVTRGDIRDLLILVPPGSMKTLLVGVFWPSWEWGPGRKPDTKWIYASYSQSLSAKSARLHRNLILKPWYQKRWGDLVQIDRRNSRLVNLFDNTAMGSRFSTSTAGEVTGRHGDRLVFDDLVKAQDATGRSAVEPQAIEKANEFWTHTMPTRATDPATVTHVGVMQRLHQNDTAAVCKEMGYEVLEIPMEFEGSTRATSIGFRDPRKKEGELLWPQRVDAEAVAKLKNTLGRDYFSQYQQDPAPETGIEVKKEWLKFWGTPGAKWQFPTPGKMIWFQSWDLARKDHDGADYVVGQTWCMKDNDFLLIDQARGRWEYTLCLEKMVAEQLKYPQVTSVIIEDAANGTAALSSLKGVLRGMVGVTPSKSKVMRLRACAPLFQAGQVFLPDPKTHPWVEGCVREVLAFPVGKHDDQVDAMTQALNHQQKNNSGYLAALKKIGRQAHG